MSKNRILVNLIQGIFIFVFIFISFWIMDLFHSELFAASLGASTFIAFAFLTAKTGNARFLIGGYFIGSVCGIVINLIKGCFELLQTNFGLVFMCAAVAFFTSFGMLLFHCEHPPSVALAISIVLSPHPMKLAAFALVAIIMLSICRLGLLYLLRIFHID